MLLEPLGRGAYYHAFLDCGDTRWQELVAALDLDETKPARTDFAQAFKMAQSGDVDVVLARHFKDCLAPAGR